MQADHNLNGLGSRVASIVAHHDELLTQWRYRIVASTNTCYYSKNQICYFLKSRILACRNFFFRNKTFLIVVRISLNFVRIHEILNHESSLIHHSTPPILIFNREIPQNFRSPGGIRRGLDYIALVWLQCTKSIFFYLFGHENI